jgi:hypothetical protein
MLATILTTLEAIQIVRSPKTVFAKPQLGLLIAFLLIAGLPIAAYLVLR